MEGFQSGRFTHRLRATAVKLVAFVALVATSIVIVGASPSLATIRLHHLGVGKLEVSGNLQSQQLIRHRSSF